MNIKNLNEELKTSGDSDAKSISVVRLTTSMWSDRRGIHIKRSLAFLKKRSSKDNWIEEEVNCIGAEEFAKHLVNLNQSPDGVYLVETCNEKTDWESGTMDSYDYILIFLGT
jgi:GTP cyclohydrolase FolE2